ncbi:MAG: T9SS type A sorting domain-containing protein, partial [Saprospiraceae bacterium]|nr:T9SS type A sorting domain-containing protein [Saprospiraceae bacterium]
PVLLTGIPRIGEKTDISISPNPTSGIFKVELKHAMENINLQIFNSKGQSIRSEAFANTRLAVIDLSAFSAGPYFIGIMADGKFYYTCVIKR